MKKNFKPLEIEYDHVIYSLNSIKKTASVIGFDNCTNEIFIPKSLIHLKKEYLITFIQKSSFEGSGIKSIEFANDSQIQVI